MMINKILFILLVFIGTIGYSQTCEYTASFYWVTIVVDGVNQGSPPSPPPPLTFDVGCGSVVDEYFLGFMLINSTIVTCEACVVPVELIYASYDGEYLNWATATETNNDFFVIKIFGENYKVVNFLMVKGSGNSNELHYYTQTLKKYEGNYGELHQVDYDGVTEKLFRFYITTSQTKGVLLAPNPAKNGKSVSVIGNEDNNTIIVYDMAGKQVNAEITNNRITGLASGMYIVRVGANYQGRLIIQ